MDRCEQSACEDDCTSRVESFTECTLYEAPEQQLFSRADQQELEGDQKKEDTRILSPDLDDLILSRAQTEGRDYCGRHKEQPQDRYTPPDNHRPITFVRETNWNESESEITASKIENSDAPKRHSLEEERTQNQSEGWARREVDSEQPDDRRDGNDYDSPRDV